MQTPDRPPQRLLLEGGGRKNRATALQCYLGSARPRRTTALPRKHRSARPGLLPCWVPRLGTAPKDYCLAQTRQLGTAQNKFLERECHQHNNRQKLLTRPKIIFSGPCLSCAKAVPNYNIFFWTLSSLSEAGPCQKMDSCTHKNLINWSEWSDWSDWSEWSDWSNNNDNNKEI